MAEASHALLFCTQLQNRLTRWPRESHEERYPLGLLTGSWEGEEDRRAASAVVTNVACRIPPPICWLQLLCLE